MAVLLPTVLTIWIFVWGYTFIEENISCHIAKGLRRLIGLIPGDYVETRLDQIWYTRVLSIAGFLVALCLVLVVGALLASVVGRSLWRMIEKFIMNTPVLKQVYPYVKQVTDFFFTREEQKQLFSRVVAIEYPRRGIWSLGFVTGSGLAKVTDSAKKELLSVLVPTSPTPFTGFVIMVPRKQTVELDMTVEQALRFVVSGGVITPNARRAAPALPSTHSESTERT